MKLRPETAHWVNPRLLIAVVMAVILAVLLFLLWPTTKPSVMAVERADLKQGELGFEAASPLPQHVVLDAKRVALGERLFHEVRLSSDDTISCASCHGLNTGGVDNRFRSIGVKGGVGGVNSPTVFNSGFNFVQFWDGRAPTLEAQIEGPVNHPLEMGSNWGLVTGKLRQDASYPRLFDEIYRDGITADNIKDAIATFERSLVTPDSRFDRFLRGEAAALNEDEARGYELFRSYGCSSCHQGVNLGGNMYEKMGLMGDYFADRGNLTEADNGRYNLNHDPRSMHEFRVPSLRNVALTAPYFHDSHAATLEQAVAIMAKYQLGRPMPVSDLNAIVSFLRSLSGTYKGKSL